MVRFCMATERKGQREKGGVYVENNGKMGRE